MTSPLKEWESVEKLLMLHAHTLEGKIDVLDLKLEASVEIVNDAGTALRSLQSTVEAFNDDIASLFSAL